MMMIIQNDHVSIVLKFQYSFHLKIRNTIIILIREEKGHGKRFYMIILAIKIDTMTNHYYILLKNILYKFDKTKMFICKIANGNLMMNNHVLQITRD